MTASVGALLALGAEQLKEAGIADSRWDSEVLLMHAMGIQRARLYAHMDDAVASDIQGIFLDMIQRRATCMPVQYITGHQEFMGMEFYVAPGVLIPRPETEHVVETALSLAKDQPVLQLVDLGIGSGAIAISIARYHPGAKIYGVDISADALTIAHKNIHRYQLEGRITTVHGDLWEALTCSGMNGRVDGIVSNPPYIADKEMDMLEQQVKDYEPLTALSGGADGLDFYRRILDGLDRFLAPQGWIVLEVGAGQGVAVKHLMDQTGILEPAQVVHDYMGWERVLWSRRKQPMSHLQDEGYA
jgi:release factor glutamine methyltransferase